MIDLTPDELQTWLEWAGLRLVAMPGQRTGPADLKIIWPEYSQDQFEILDFRRSVPLRASGPSKDEIPIMDEILLLPNLASDVIRRRILHVRLLIHPIRGHNLYSWTSVSKILHSSPKRVKRLHSLALLEVSRKVPTNQVCRLADALQGVIPLRENTS